MANLDPNIPGRLNYFLYCGKEYPDYHPGHWFVHNYFLAKNVPSIEEMAKQHEVLETVPVTRILTAFESNLVPNPETMVFALAVCCRQMESEVLRRNAYEALNKICVTPEHLILFVKFASQLSKQKELDPTGNSKSGWGQGLRKAVNNWYLSKSPMELAQCVTRCKGRYGWKHKDIIKLSHPVPKDLEAEMVLQYVIYGLEEVKKTFGKNAKCTEILNYIENVEKFKHCKDVRKAVELLKKYNLTLDHVPGHFLKSKEIWNALIPSMNLNTLLKNLLRLHNLKLLKESSSTTRAIVDQISNKEKITRDKVHPALVLITLKDYHYSGKPPTNEKQKVKENIDKPLPDPPMTSFNIEYALHKMLNFSFHNLPRTGLRYMVTMRMDQVMAEKHAWRSGNLTGAEAAIMIAHAFLRSEENVTVAVFKDSGIHIVHLDKTGPFTQELTKLQYLPLSFVNLARPITWASQWDKEYDVFINVVDQIFEKTNTSEKALTAYQAKRNQNTKLINCAVCSSWSNRKEKPNARILTINGFDASIFTAMQGFSKNYF